MTTRYRVRVLCDECSEPHSAEPDLYLQDGPDVETSLTDSFPDGLPRDVEDLRRRLFTCPRTGWSFVREDPAQIFLAPIGRRQPQPAPDPLSG